MSTATGNLFQHHAHVGGTPLVTAAHGMGITLRVETVLSLSDAVISGSSHHIGMIHKVLIVVGVVLVVTFVVSRVVHARRGNDREPPLRWVRGRRRHRTRRGGHR